MKKTVKTMDCGVNPVENPKKQTLKEAKVSLDFKFENQTLKEQAEGILAYLNSAHPHQTIVPQSRVDLLRVSLPKFGDIEKQIQSLAGFLLDEFGEDLQDGSAVDNAIRLLRNYKQMYEALMTAFERLEAMFKKRWGV